MKRFLPACFLALAFIFWGSAPGIASKKETSHKHVTHAKKKTSHKKSSHKKSTHKEASHKKSSKSKKGQAGTYYVKPIEENLRVAPSGKRVGTLVQGAPVTVDKVRGSWAHVTVRAWIWRPSLTKTKPKMSSELLIEDVAGAFEKKGFVIKGTLDNQTKVSFAKVVLQGELFKGKKRVAHKTLTLFSRKKPLPAGRSYSFKIFFKRQKGFDGYGVHILSASQK